jgi:ATP-binding cassette, subfamily B, bacterial
MSVLRTGSRRTPPPTPATGPTTSRAVRDGLLPFARPHRAMLGRGLVFSCLLVGTRLALPLPLTAVVDRSATTASASGTATPVAVLSAAFVALAVIAGLAEHHQRLAFAHFAGRSVADARDAALARVQHDEGDASGDLTTEVLGDSVRVKQGLKGILNHITVNGLLVFGVCAALAMTETWLGLVQSAGAILLILVALGGATRVGRVAAQHRHRETGLARSVHRLASQQASDDAATVDTVRGLDADSGVADIAMTRWEGITTWAVHVVLVASAAAVLVLGLGNVRAGEMSPGALFAAMSYLLVLHGPATRFARQITRTAPLLVSARSLGRTLASPPQKGSP